MASETPILSFVIPCLNEAPTLAGVVDDCIKGGNACGQPYEIVVADNGSTDGSREIATEKGARVVPVSLRGYGSALISGIKAARGSYVLMGDADSTYEFERAPQFLLKLQQGYDLVMGNRFQGTIAPGAMPLLHRYLGNPILSAMGRLFFGITIGDFHCGLRGFNREAILDLNLNCLGMEFASEMVIKSSLQDLRITEIATHLRPNPPGRTPHLKTWRDGWRHLKYMLSFSPRYSFLPLAFTLLVSSLLLVLAYTMKLWILFGPNTLVFATAGLVAAVGIFSDYLLTREIIYSRYSLRRSPLSSLLDSILGLHKGTDRLFKISAFSFILSLINLIILGIMLYHGIQGMPVAGVIGFVACVLMVSAVFIYLTAAKITTFRSLS